MEEQEKQALVTALRLLTATPKSRQKLQEKLEGRGYSKNVLQNTLDHLEKQGLLNDRAYGQSVVQSYRNYRLAGRKKIIFELKRKGLQPSLIHELLGNYSAEEEREKAHELAKAKFEKLKKLEPVKRRKKLYDFLIRRGFDFNISRDTVEQLERNDLNS